MFCPLMQAVAKPQPAEGRGGQRRPRYWVLGLTVGLVGDSCGFHKHICTPGCSWHLRGLLTMPNRQTKESVLWSSSGAMAPSELKLWPGCFGGWSIRSVDTPLGWCRDSLWTSPWAECWVCWVTRVAVVKVPGRTGIITTATRFTHISPAIGPRTQSTRSLLHSPQGCFIRTLVFLPTDATWAKAPGNEHCTITVNMTVGLDIFHKSCFKQVFSCLNGLFNK